MTPTIIGSSLTLPRRRQEKPETQFEKMKRLKDIDSLQSILKESQKREAEIREKTLELWKLFTGLDEDSRMIKEELEAASAEAASDLNNYPTLVEPVLAGRSCKLRGKLTASERNGGSGSRSSPPRRRRPGRRRRRSERGWHEWKVRLRS